MIDPLIYFLLFVKASLFSTGGFSNLPSLHQDLLAAHWAQESDFGESIAIGQISPGPNGLWVISLGYFSYGYAGAILALVAITLPPLLVLAIAALYDRIERQRWVDGLMRGVSLVVVGILLTVCWTVMRQPGTDWTSWPIALAASGLAFSRRVNLLVILAIAGGVGFALYR
jgi:chromate transporter